MNDPLPDSRDQQLRLIDQRVCLQLAASFAKLAEQGVAHLPDNRFQERREAHLFRKHEPRNGGGSIALDDAYGGKQRAPQKRSLPSLPPAPIAAAFLDMFSSDRVRLRRIARAKKGGLTTSLLKPGQKKRRAETLDPRLPFRLHLDPYFYAPVFGCATLVVAGDWRQIGK